jgi:squalene-associated FAD-dependent desaturase
VRSPVEHCDVAVIGAGWAGLAAAVELTTAGRRVLLMDSAPVAGGRARALTLRLGDTQARVDNGQHLLMGAYRETLALAARLAPATDGVPPETPGLVRQPLRLDAVDGLRIEAANLPAPLHLLVALLRARGLSVADRARATAMLLRLKLSGWRVREGETVTALLDRFVQPEGLRRRLWEPLALGALNTPAAEACAATFARVLRDTLGGRADASDFVLPAATLSEVLPSPAHDWLQASGARVLLRTTARALSVDAQGWQVRTDQMTVHAESLVLAVPPWTAARLLGALDLPPEGRRIVAALTGFVPAPIATVYLGWHATHRVHLPSATLLDARPDDDAPGQWLFDRGPHGTLRVGAVVVSAAPDALDRQRLAQQVAHQVATQMRTPPPDHAVAIIEKRATFLCTPDRPRLHPDALSSACGQAGVAWSRLMLAGDYAWPDYPATLEAAVRSGREAARVLSARNRASRG